MKEPEMEAIGEWIADVLGRGDESGKRVRREVEMLCEKFPLYCRDDAKQLTGCFLFSFQPFSAGGKQPVRPRIFSSTCSIASSIPRRASCSPQEFLLPARPDIFLRRTSPTQFQFEERNDR